MIKICEQCGKEFDTTDHRHRVCPTCFKQGVGNKGVPSRSQRPSNSFRPDTSTSFRFDGSYLRDGYFEEKNGKRYIRLELLDKTASDIAKLLGNQGMKSAQLRKFFNKARGIEAKLDRARDFDGIKADLTRLKPNTAYQQGRSLIPVEFLTFMEKNIALATQDQYNFREGFLSHFESVVGFFVYYFRDRETSR